MIQHHDAAHTHVTGASEYVEDRAWTQGELFVEVCYSTEAHARIEALDFKAALALPGVHGIFTAKDFHENIWGSIFKDQPLLAAEEVNYVGEAVALVAAESMETARAARDLIRIRYRKLPALLSVDAAKAAKSFIGSHRKIERGEVDKNLAQAPHRIEGKIVIHGQDHFYLETQCSVAYPLEDGQIEVHSSSQHPTETQHVVAHALGLTDKDVVCVVKRMGGAFGGKESQAAPLAAYAALVAHKLKRPARIAFTKDDDMIMTGKRNPFENIYRVGFDENGYILALDVELYSNGGAYADLSTSIMERAMLHSDNAYFIPHMRVTGQVCRTHVHPHTAFRGFGGPKGVATIERIVEKVAHALGKDPLEIRKKNCYATSGERAVTHYGQVVKNNCLPRLFEQLEKDCDYASRRRAIEAANQEALADPARAPLRGLSLTAVKFGISFTTRFLNQANALVLLHRDGSVQISTGATEMGQGVNARIAALVASELGLERTEVRVMPTRTDKNANTSPTAASSGTDLNGAAALLATRKIKARLSELAVKTFGLPPDRWAGKAAGQGTEPEIRVRGLQETFDPNLGADWQTGIASYHGVVFEKGEVYVESDPKLRMSLADLVNEAYLNRISLSDYGFYFFPGLSFNKVTGEGEAFLYFTQGVAASEVEVNRDTGEVKVLRADVLMDLGRPINESLDLVQVTGGFIQGMGWVTTEKLFYNPNGLLLSHSPSTYKIPNVQDTPRVFHAKLFENNDNHQTVRGTKAVGEPPLLLGISVWTAIHDALKSLPQHETLYPNLELPATSEQVMRSLEPAAFAEWDGQK